MLQRVFIVLHFMQPSHMEIIKEVEECALCVAGGLLAQIICNSLVTINALTILKYNY